MNHERSTSFTAGDQPTPGPRRGVALLSSSAENHPSFARRQQSTLTMLLAHQPYQAALPAAAAKAVSLRRPRRSFRLAPRWLLLGILILQAGLSVRLLWANTAFEDEATYLYAGHLEWAHWLHGAASPTLLNFPTWFSGAPVVYPPLGAIADSLDGLTGARLLSLAFMLAASACLYGTTKRLLNTKAALFAILTFAVIASTQLLAVFATYDPMAIFLMALATWLGIRSAEAGWAGRCLLLVVSGLTLALADATKYATALWTPAVLALVAIATWRVQRLRTGLGAAALVMICWAAAVGIGLKIAGPTYMVGILFTTLARGASTQSPITVLTYAFGIIWLVLILGMMAVIASLSDSKSVRALCITALGAGLLAPLNEARIRTTASLWKHSDFGAWFTAIAAGYLLARLSRIDKRAAWSGVLAGVACLSLVGSVSYASMMATTWWPNSSGAIKALSFIRPSSGPVLMDSSWVGDYYLHDQVYPGQIAGIGSDFIWWDDSLRREINGAPAVREAIQSNYFAAVEIDGLAIPVAEYDAALHQLSKMPTYRLIYKQRPWMYHGRRLYEEVWRRVKA